MLSRKKETKQDDKNLDGAIDDILNGLKNEDDDGMGDEDLSEELTWETRTRGAGGSADKSAGGSADKSADELTSEADALLAGFGADLSDEQETRERGSRRASRRGSSKREEGKQNADEQADEATERPKPRISSLLIVGASVALVLLIGFVLFFGFKWNPFANLGAKVAAKVNGDRIMVAELDARMDSLLAQNPSIIDEQQGGMNEAIIRKSVLDMMIDNLLLEQEAAREGITISDEEVQEQVKMRADSYPDEEAFEKDLSDNGYTMEFFENQIRIGMLATALMQKKVPDTAITDTAIKEYYEENLQSFVDAEGNERSLEEVTSSIRSILLARQRNTERADLLVSLREKADIEILDEKILANGTGEQQ